MPYFITNDNPDCSGWAVEKDDGEVVGCHRTRQEAIDQMVAVSVAEGIEPGGERAVKAGSAGSVSDGMREEARRGIDWRNEYGRGGTEVGLGTARRILADDVSVELAVKMRAYFARHEVDQQGEGWNRDEPGYPSAGRIAWALWGGDPGRAWSERVVAAAREEATPPGTRSGVNILHKSAAASFDVKDASEAAPHGEVTALVSVFGNEDLVGDRVMPGAFAKSLENIESAGRAIPFVWSHDWSRPESYIGKITKAEETADGLLVTASLFDTPTAQHIRTLLASGVVSEFSFAYDVVDQREGADGVNELTQLHILEAGPTLKGANPATQLVGVRSALAADTLAGTPHKVGRAISAKNEQKLRDARGLLDEVLGSMETASEPAKTEEPEEVKVEEPGMPADVALLMLELEELEDQPTPNPLNL